MNSTNSQWTTESTGKRNSSRTTSKINLIKRIIFPTRIINFLEKTISWDANQCSPLKKLPSLRLPRSTSKPKPRRVPRPRVSSKIPTLDHSRVSLVMKKAQDSPCTRQERSQEKDIQIQRKSSGFMPKHYVTQVKLLSSSMMESLAMIANKVTLVTAG